MLQRLRASAVAGVVLAVLALVASRPASALTESDILGQWCGDSGNPTVTNLNFSSKQMVVKFVKGGGQAVYTITRYQFNAGVIVVNWLDRQNKEVFTEYGDFSSDRRTMAQLPGDGFPRYIFRRC